MDAFELERLKQSIANLQRRGYQGYSLEELVAAERAERDKDTAYYDDFIYPGEDQDNADDETERD